MSFPLTMWAMTNNLWFCRIPECLCVLVPFVVYWDISCTRPFQPYQHTKGIFLDAFSHDLMSTWITAWGSKVDKYHPLQEILQDQQVGLSQAHMKSLLLPRVPVHVRPYCTLQKQSLCFPQSWGASAIKPHWPSKPNTLGLFPCWEAWCGAQRRISVIQRSPFCGLPIRMVWGLIMSWLRSSHHLAVSFLRFPPCISEHRKYHLVSPNKLK